MRRWVAEGGAPLGPALSGVKAGSGQAAGEGGSMRMGSTGLSHPGVAGSDSWNRRYGQAWFWLRVEETARWGHIITI